MISPQMSAWVRVWAWVSGGQRGGVLLLFRRPTGARSRLRGPRPPEGRRAAGGRRGLRACCGSPHHTGRGVQLGTAASLSKKNIPQTPPKPQETTKKGGLLGGGAEGRARYIGASLQRGDPPAGAAPPGPPGPGQPPGPAARKVCPAPSGRLAPQPAAAPWPPFGAVLSARRFGDRLSVAIKIKINSY